jgi:mono/diheme cytochrome c family protein
MAEPSRQYLFTSQQIRMAFVLSGIGMIAVIVGLLVLATSQPQGRLTPPDTSEFEATLAAASEDLTGFERIGDTRARIDIDTAMALVVERGVDLSLISVENDATPEPAAAGDGSDGPSAQAALPDGQAVYANCSGCHQATGAGIPGAFPPLDGHAADLFEAEGDPSGRDYLIQVVLQGVQGEIDVGGTTYTGLMPPWPQLSDGEIAAVLNHTLGSWSNGERLGDFEPYSAAEVAAQREVDLGDLLEVRGGLELP